MTQRLNFPEWYYGGPYLRVQDPDRDLPRRDPSAPVSPEWQTAIEFNGMVAGERFVAPFRDANTIDDILGDLLLAETYPMGWDENERHYFPTIQGAVAELVLRLETKLRSNRSRVRANWFNLALDQIREAGRLFAAARYSEAGVALREAESLIRQGNRANRRKASFSVGPDGTVRRIG
jgi:hypothetical protein